MELGTELQKERFITLVSPEDDLHLTEEEFAGPEKRIPAIEQAHLIGSRNLLEYTDKDLGITIMDDRIVIKKANDLKSKGLFDVFVDIGSLGSQDTSMICTMAVKDTRLESDVAVVEDSEEIPLEKRYGGTTRGWKLRGDNREFRFFAPADPKFLSQLRFSFRQASNFPESSK